MTVLKYIEYLEEEKNITTERLFIDEEKDTGQLYFVVVTKDGTKQIIKKVNEEYMEITSDVKTQVENYENNYREIDLSKSDSYISKTIIGTHVS